MSKRSDKDGTAVTIDYKSLGTIALDNLMQAIWEDIQALKETYGVKFVTGVRFTVPVTNEYGEPLLVRKTDGAVMRRIDTHYYRPACLDYQL